MGLLNGPTTAVAVAAIRPPRTGQFAKGAILAALVLTLLHVLTQVITNGTGHVLFGLSSSDGRLPLSALPQLLRAELQEGSQATLADAALSLRLFAALRRPFSAEVLGRGRWLTVVLLSGGVIQSLADTWANFYLSTEIGLLTAGNVPIEKAEAFLGGDYSVIGTNVPQRPVSILVAGIVALGSALSSVPVRGSKKRSTVSSERFAAASGVDADADVRAHRIRCHLDEVVLDRGMTLTELASRTGMANLSNVVAS